LTKGIGPDGIPNSIKGSEIFTLLLCHIFNLSLSVIFPSLWKQAAVAPIFKKRYKDVVVDYSPVSILNNFSKIVCLKHDHLSCNFKCKLHPNQLGFVESKYMIANLGTYLNDI
jgi:hypothetical protein